MTETILIKGANKVGKRERFVYSGTKTILITGANKGLGLASARQFSEGGWNVFGTSRTQEGIDSLVLDVPNSNGAVCDSKYEDQVVMAVRKAVDTYGRIDVLMNNIGIPSREPIYDMSSERFNQVLEANIGSCFLFTREVVPVMKNQKEGRIININSLAGLQPYGNSLAYVASKYAMTGFGKSLRHDVYEDNIQVTNIYPGGIDTTFHSTPRPEFMKPQDVAEVIYFVAQRPWNANIADITLAPARDARLP